MLFFIEGLWGTGKSHICHYLKREHGFIHIKEPNHIKNRFGNKSRKDITEWYLEEHIKNLEHALKSVNVVIERSPISSIVFIKTFFKQNIYNKSNILSNILYFEKLLKQCKETPYVVYLEAENLKKLAEHISKNPYVRNYSKLNFLKAMENNFSKYINKLTKAKLIKLIKIRSDNNLEDFKKHFNLLTKQ